MQYDRKIPQVSTKMRIAKDPQIKVEGQVSNASRRASCLEKKKFPSQAHFRRLFKQAKVSVDINPLH